MTDQLKISRFFKTLPRQYYEHKTNHIDTKFYIVTTLNLLGMAVTYTATTNADMKKLSQRGALLNCCDREK